MLALLVLLVAFAASTPASLQPATLILEGPVRFEPGDAAALEIEGVGRFRGVVEVALTGRGIGATNEVALEDYVEGIAEMPSSWPAPALEAQAIAARTYALWDARRSGAGSKAALRYDICASTACQVYAGLEKALDTRWSAAVRATAGQTLLDGDGPILARYFSTAGGRTRFNQDVFVGEGSYPYLVPVDTPEEASAPLYRWQVVVPSDRLLTILAESPEIRPAGLLSAIGVVEHPDGAGMPSQVVIDGTGGRRVVRAATFARAFSLAAEKLYPADYPGQYPAALPSSRYSLRLGPEGLVIEGRGYGHAVGMSQYGAKGLAEQGLSAADILSHYYGGLRPQALSLSRSCEFLRRSETCMLRVGVVEESSEVVVALDEQSRITGARGRVILDGLRGRVRATPRPDGTLLVELPPGVAAPFVVTGLDIGEAYVEEGTNVRASAVLSGEGTARLVAVQGAGVVATTISGAGRVHGELSQLGAGEWRVLLDGVPEAGEIPVSVTARPPPPVPAPGRSPRWWWLWPIPVLGATGLLVWKRHRATKGEG